MSDVWEEGGKNKPYIGNIGEGPLLSWVNRTWLDQRTTKGRNHGLRRHSKHEQVLGRIICQPFQSRLDTVVVVSSSCRRRVVVVSSTSPSTASRKVSPKEIIVDFLWRKRNFQESSGTPTTTSTTSTSTSTSTLTTTSSETLVVRERKKIQPVFFQSVRRRRTINLTTLSSLRFFVFLSTKSFFSTNYWKPEKNRSLKKTNNKIRKE